MNLPQLIEELKRRNVFKVATAYAIAGWLIIQVVTIIEPPLALPDWFDTMVIVLLGIGFPLALIFAWAFELTPDGIKKSVEVEQQVSIRSQTGKKLNGVIIGVLSIPVIFLLVERVFFAPHAYEEIATNYPTHPRDCLYCRASFCKHECRRRSRIFLRWAVGRTVECP